jgi:hypothetical protein
LDGCTGFSRGWLLLELVVRRVPSRGVLPGVVPARHRRRVHRGDDVGRRRDLGAVGAEVPADVGILLAFMFLVNLLGAVLLLSALVAWLFFSDVPDGTSSLSRVLGHLCGMSEFDP